jgi:glycosyltransferase involved in cell wall biosynthesis
MPKLSILVPVYNEQASILRALEAIASNRRLDIEFEIIVVDDGSTDSTPEILRSHADLYTALLTLPRNGGKGAAVRAGLARATGDYVLIQDADLEYDPADYEKLLSPALKRGADVVLGSRLAAPPVTRVHYFWHKVGNRCITLMFNILYNTTFTDIYCGYLLYRRTLLDPGELRANGWSQHAEMLARLIRRATSIYEVPVSYFGRTYADGKKIRATDIFPVIMEILIRRFVR